MAKSPENTKRRQLILQNLEAWIRRLIDTSRRNNLLYLRRDSKGLLKLDTNNADALSGLICGEKVQLSDWFGEDHFTEASARMTEIYRSARANEEERGLTTLFLALLAVTWPSEDGGRPADAPVLLRPVRVERAQGGRGWSLVADGDMELNISLLQVLRNDLRLDTAPLEALFNRLVDENSLTLEDLSTLSAALADMGSKVPGFEVHGIALIGNFSFMKMALVQDLQEAGEALYSHDFIAALAGDMDAVGQLRARAGGITPKDVDAVHPTDDYTFMPADSSQMAAIRNILVGQDGVIQGPPGTGKSQTIANLIGEMVARGKRVLFVAEKRAAIQVVK